MQVAAFNVLPSVSSKVKIFMVLQRKSMSTCADVMGYSRKYPHTPMDDIGNPVRNDRESEYDWKSINFPKIL